MRHLKSDSPIFDFEMSGILARSRAPVTLGDRAEADPLANPIRHPALPRHLHRNYQHWHWLSHLHEG
ncbi:MAG: hypothetical protein Fur0046_22210 [Cyanobacteria bacterium J069]|nr:MAG: hypothetical protein D6742_08730 [Cyanobacteria bacterium J069]